MREGTMLAALYGLPAAIAEDPTNLSLNCDYSSSLDGCRSPPLRFVAICMRLRGWWDGDSVPLG